MKKFALVLDVGTTGVKSLVFSEKFDILAKSYKPLKEIKPQYKHIEQDPREILDLAIESMKGAVRDSGVSIEDISGVAITNQRESIVSWNKKNSQPFYPVISWKDCRTEEYCKHFSDGEKEMVRQKTGLSIMPYFSASKINWLLNNLPEIKLAKEEGDLACGTIDSWLIWNLTEKKDFVTDWTNASRTLLFDIKNKQWDNILLDLFEIPLQIMPMVRKSREIYGMLDSKILGRAIPIKSVCGDQQSSLYSAGTEVGTTKITYGTGIFIMQILGNGFSLVEDFYTTLDVEGNFSLEAKIEHGGKEIEALLDDKEKLSSFLRNMALEADFYIKKLPVRPDKIVIDGGVSRDGIIGRFQKEISEIEIDEQPVFDGTALGSAKIIFV